MYGKSKQYNEEPISNYLYNISYTLTNKIKINPNIITTFRLILMIIVYYILIYKKKYSIIAGFLFLFCYFLDHLDGEMARQHDLITTFGDYYDHIVDNTYIIPVIIILYYKFRDRKNFHQIGIIFLLLTISSTMLISCQEKIFWKNQKEYGRKQSISLSSLTGFCMTDDISKLRYFGLGLWHLYIFYLIIIK